MNRVGRVLFVVLVASCAQATVSPPTPDGGSGGSGGARTSSSTVGSGGGGGALPDAGSDIDYDAGPCAPFKETYMPACLVCLAMNCCDVAVACFDVPDCFGFASCQQNCPPGVPAPDGGGPDGGGPDGGGPDGGVSDAGVSDGGVSDGGVPDGGGPDGGVPDGGVPDGGGADGGVPAGGDNACLDACTQNYPMAEPAFGAMTACLHTSCAGACPY